MQRAVVSCRRAYDRYYKKISVELGATHRAFDDPSVDAGDIPDGWIDERIRQEVRDRYLGDSTVTVVPVGRETRRRRLVDRECRRS